MPVTFKTLPFLIDCTRNLSILELSDQALSSTGNKFVFFPSTSKITSLLRLKLNPAFIETSWVLPPLMFVTKTYGFPLLSLLNLPTVLVGSEVIKQV